MKQIALIAAMVTFVLACAGETPERTTRTQRERDSMFGSMPIPGTQGIRGALSVADSAAARSARIDSLSRQ